MLRKHPVLQFSATGPIDRAKSPYKWWCRVCRVELSLMSRGVLELLSHYKTEGHLVKEHRIRLETTGTPLFDQNENELLGIALQEAKRIAKEMYPIPPQLDSCKLLVGQEKLPDLSTTTSPSEIIIAQISILEHGLRNGGHIDCLIGIWNEMTIHTLGASEARNFSWNHPRLFVSFVFSLNFVSVCVFTNLRLHLYRLWWSTCSKNWPIIVLPPSLCPVPIHFCSTYCHRQLRVRKLLVWECVLSNLPWFGSERTFDSEENLCRHFLIHYFV